MKTFSYLALGDSYTIGEQVPLHGSFPYQAVQLLRNMGLPFCAPEIVAKTGWTTDELSTHISTQQFLETYDVVSLLIGVNNQYRGRSPDNYKEEFEGLLQRAIKYAGDKHEHVFVISIPDWGVTPFAEGRDRKQIAGEIDQYNSACKLITDSRHCHYIEITASQRADAKDLTFLAADGLHPSDKEYAKWAYLLSGKIRTLLS